MAFLRYFLLTIGLISAASTSAQSTTRPNLDRLISKWVGQYPHTGKSFFLNEPEIKKTLEQCLGKDRFKELNTGDYGELPIDYVDGYFVVRLLPNRRLMREEKWEWIYIVIRKHTGDVQTAIRNFEDRVEWRYSGENSVPLGILKMLDLPVTRKYVSSCK